MENTKQEITQLDDIKLLVDTFYGEIREDDLLKDIFNDVIRDNWPEHLNKMYRFWETVLLGNHTYYGSPFHPHANLPIEKKHFERWIKLFTATVDEHFTGEKAEEAKWRANKMAEMFLYKIEYHKGNQSKPLI